MKQRLENWLAGHPLLMPYIAFIVTLELVVMLIK